MSTPAVLTTPAAMRDWSMRARGVGSDIGFVPTMGALHAGHLSLMDASTTECGLTVVSIFVNQLQFNRPDDFDAYPRRIDDDLAACGDAGVDAVYLPSHAEMYPSGFETTVAPGTTADVLEGVRRPGHFSGVVTVVAKLFNAVRPDRAYFGRKDYQQWRVIEAMTRDLDYGIEIRGLPTVRESDGLAMSSRNALLAGPERRAATVIPRALEEAASAWRSGLRRPEEVCRVVTEILETEPAAAIEYVEAADPHTLGAPASGSIVVMVAVWFGAVRLIDNVELLAE